MLERRIGPAGAVYYVSRLLQAVGAPHAFSTRLGGSSPPPFDSLNLGNPSTSDIQDTPQRIAANYRLLLSDLRCSDRILIRVHQVHGSSVALATHGHDLNPATPADAIITSDPGYMLSIRVADCAPILLATPDGRFVAVVHAGWRGTVAGVLPAAVAALLRISAAKPADLLAAIGPCIGADAYEVGPEVLAEFDRLFGPNAPLRRRHDGKGHVDLRQTLRRQLLDAGFWPDRIDISDHCTFRDGDEFFSHRRDRGRTGRMAALIGPASLKFTH